jgi:hypothetical protein
MARRPVRAVAPGRLLAANRLRSRLRAHPSFTGADYRPPAIAGTMETSSPCLSAVFSPWRKRMSSWLT